MPPPRILIASPVRQKPAILAEFLRSLAGLDSTGLQVAYAFVDDNEDPSSTELLRIFIVERGGTLLDADAPASPFVCDAFTHHWRDDLMWRVAGFKDRIIRQAIEQGWDYLFLLDSDLVLHPRTLLQLLLAERDIVSEVFWTRWTPDSLELPQVWLFDACTLFPVVRGRSVPPEVAASQVHWFLEQLRVPGVYKVGGLGACTLISRRALRAGVHFGEIGNLSFLGEDRHFCVRAMALGLELHVDTHLPATHLYRDSDLARLMEPRAGSIVPVDPPSPPIWRKASGNRLTLCMAVRNEAHRFLREVLAQAVRFVDDFVILDDASTDGTVDLCREIIGDRPLTMVVNRERMFGDEVTLRKRQWELAASTHPDWLLMLDADEIFEDRAVTALRPLIDQDTHDAVGFRLYDFWDEGRYRDDDLWNAHLRFWPLLVRFDPDRDFHWRETPLHCGRMPLNAFDGPMRVSELRIRHLGWMREADRVARHRTYMLADPEGRHGSMDQYRSILDPCPRLVRWEE